MAIFNYRPKTQIHHNIRISKKRGISERKKSMKNQRNVIRLKREIQRRIKIEKRGRLSFEFIRLD